MAGDRRIQIVAGGINIRTARIWSGGGREEVTDDFCRRGIDRDCGWVDCRFSQGIGQSERYGTAANAGEVAGGPARGQRLSRDECGLIKANTFVVEIEEQLILDKRATDRGAEGVGAQGGVESRDSIRGVPTLTGKIPKTAAMK